MLFNYKLMPEILTMSESILKLICGRGLFLSKPIFKSIPQKKKKITNIKY
jgi:hypothetical protein